MEPQTPPPAQPSTPTPPRPIQWLAPDILIIPSFWRRYAIGALVIVASIATAMYFSSASEPIVEASPSPSVSVSADPTADWKTYTNTQYGFEVKYPSDWGVLMGQDGQVILTFSGEAPPVDSVTVSFRVVALGASVGMGSAEWKPLSFAGRDAYIWEGPSMMGGPVQTIVVPLDINGINSTEIRIDSGADVTIVDQILSTFKFIEAETAQEAKVRMAIEKVLNQQAIQNIRLLSLDIRGGAITMNFSKEIASQGMAAFEQVFMLVSNATYPFVQGTELTYEVFIDGIGVGEVFK